MRGVSRQTVIAIVMIAGLAIALRVINIGKEAMWHDEVASLRMTNGTLKQVLSATAKDATPLGYFVGLHTWRKVVPAGDGWARVYSALWSIIGVGLVAGFAWWLPGRGHGLVVLLFAAVAPLDIYFAQELRMYSQANAFGVLSSWMLLYWIRSAGGRKAVVAGILYAVSAACLLLTHYVALMLVLAQGVFAVIYFARKRDWRQIASLAGIGCVAAGIFGIWLLYVVRVNERLSAENAAWITVSPMHYYVSYVAQEFFWGRTFTVYQKWWPVTLAVAVVVGGFGAMRSLHDGVSSESKFSRRFTFAFLVWMVFGPALLAAVVSRVYQPIYDRQRFALFLLPPFLLLMAIGCLAARQKAARASLVFIVSGILLFASVLQFRLVHKPDWRLIKPVWEEKGPPDRYVALSPLFRFPVAHVVQRRLPHLKKEELANTGVLPNGTSIWMVAPVTLLDEGMKATREKLVKLGTSETVLQTADYEVTSITVTRF